MNSWNFYIITFVLFLLICITSCREIGKDQFLIVVSYDGFRNEYLQRNITPNLLEFRRDGVYADYITNVFPTKTFTNHHSIATGLYPNIHGVTANSLYDAKLGSLKYGYEMFHYNPDVLPIWALNEKSGGTSGCMMWPGTDFEYSNFTCTYVQSYNLSISMKERVDTVISWLKDPKNPPNLVMLYLEVPDKIAHQLGPEAPEITKLVQELDLITKYIQDELKNNKIAHRANVIHLSDHGMAGVNSSHFINLTSSLQPNTFKIFGTSPVLQIVPTAGMELETYTKLKEASEESGNFNIYKPDTLPERWHATNKRRFGPIIAVANEGYAFQDMWDAAVYYEKKYNIKFTPSNVYGVHGYDNDLPVMHPIFMAKGPAFKKEHKVKPFKTVDLYSLFCKILNIKNSPQTNGTLTNVADLLEDYQSSGIGTGGIIAIVLGCAILLAVIIYGLVHLKRKRSYFFVK